MKIAVIGANGRAGRNIVKEAAERGHEATAIVREASKAPAEAAHVLVRDVFELTRADLTAFDAVVNAIGLFAEPEKSIDAGLVLIEALKGSDTRLLVVGGAGSLYVDPDKKVQLYDTPEFPAAYLPLAKSQGKNLEDLQGTSGLKWTFISPAIEFALGRRTGAYLKGKDHVLVNAAGESYVSYEDYAIAIVDELERPAHIGERFTVVSEK